MASTPNYQTGRYIYERNLKLPFSKKALFQIHPGHSELLITGRVNASPTEFEIKIMDAGDSASVYFNMHQRWNEDRTEFCYYIDHPLFDELNCVTFSQYARFPSLKPGSDFTIRISTVQEHPDKNVFHYKVRVKDDPVVMVQHMDLKDIEVAEIEIKSPNNSICVTLVQLDVTK